MPSLVKFLSVILILVALVAGTTAALIVFVKPATREMTITVPREKFQNPR